MMHYELHHGDCLEILPTLPENSVDAIVTDPPYGLGFMGKHWDHGVPGVEFWVQALRVAKPGAFLLAFGGTRTFHRMGVAIEDAGWEVRDTIMWVYGSGFPKSHDVSKAIDREAGAEREVVGESPYNARRPNPPISERYAQAGHKAFVTAPATDAAKQWDGWGTALKPANEPICMARKPLSGTVAQNVLTWGTGAINVDGCRVGTEENLARPFGHAGNNGGYANQFRNIPKGTMTGGNEQGRWPANVIHDGSGEVLAGFPVTGPSSVRPPTGKPKYTGSKFDSNAMRGSSTLDTTVRGIDDAGGSAARFFYCAKASKADRDEGLEGFPLRNGHLASREGGGGGWKADAKDNPNLPRANHHPTVKPTDLMRYLCRLVTQPGGVILDPFCGSGSTGKAAMLEGFRFVGIEQDAEYIAIARARIEHARQQAQGPLFAMAAD